MKESGNLFLSPPRRLCFGWMICPQDYTKTAKQISMKIKDESRHHLSSIGEDQNKVMDPEFFSHFLKHCKICSFPDFS